MKLKKTQLFIIEAMIELMKQYNYESISIARITQEALVARNSFYRNFESKEEVVRLHILNIIDDFSQTEQVMSMEKKYHYIRWQLFFLVSLKIMHSSFLFLNAIT